MAAVKWKEPWCIPLPVLLSALVFTLLVLLPSDSHSQWISYKRSGRHSNLWHPNMPAPRTLRHSSYSSSSSGSSSNSRDSHSQSSRSSGGGGHRPIEHRSLSHNNYHTIPGSSRDSSSSSGGAYHGQQQQHAQARYSSADYGRNGHSSSGSSSSGKNVRISDAPAKTSPSSPTAATAYHQQQRSQHPHHHQQQQQQVPSNMLTHRHLGQQHPKNAKVNWQAPPQKNGRSNGVSSAVQDSTKRPVSQHAGHLLDSWPNSNTHHHLAPVSNGGNAAAMSKNVKAGFSNLKPEQWGQNVLVSNKPIEIGVKSKAIKPSAAADSHRATDRQLVLPSGYPVKDKAAVANTINTLTKLSPKKPIFVFMRKEGILAVKSGADAGDVIKKLAGTSKLPFYNGTNVLPTHSIPTVFLAPEDMTPPSGYGKIPIPNLKPKSNATPKPTYTKILMPGGTHMKGALITTTQPTTTTTSTSTTTPSPPHLGGGLEGIAGLLQNNSINNLSLEQKLQLLTLLRNQPNHPLADQVSLAILASASTPSAAPSAAFPASPIPSASAPVPSPISPSPQPGMSSIVHGPTLAAPSQWPPQLFQGILPQGSSPQGVPNQPPPFFGQNQLPSYPGHDHHQHQQQFPGFPGGVVSSTTPNSLLGAGGSSPSPLGEPAGQNQEIHKLIGTIVESAVSNTVSTMLQHQRLMQQQSPSQPSIVGVGPPLHAHQLSGAPSRPPPPPHFGRGPPPRPPGPPRPPPFGYQQRPPFPPSPTPGRFPPHHPSAGPPPQQHALHPSAATPPPPQQNPSAMPPPVNNPSVGPPLHVNSFLQPSPSPTPVSPPPQNPTGAPHPSAHSFPPPQQQFIHQASQQRPSYQHPFVPGFQSPTGYPNPSSSLSPTVSTTPIPQFAFNPSSTMAPNQFSQQQQHQQQQQQHQQQQQQYFHPNGIRQPNNGKHPLMRMVERPFPGSKPRNPLHNALQFFGMSTPRPDPNKPPSPSSTSVMMSSTPYPSRPPMSPTPFGRPGPHQPFPSSTPGPPPQFRPQASPFPPHMQQQQQQQQQHNQQQPQFFPQQPQQQQQQQFQQQFQQSPQQAASQFQQQQQQPPAGQQQQQQFPKPQQGKKPTLIVQTPNGPAGKKNTYVITGGGNELPELNKIMKVLNDLHVDSENGAPPPQPSQSPQPPPIQQQYSPSSTTPRPAVFSAIPSTFSPSPAQFSTTQFSSTQFSPTQFSPTRRPMSQFSPNVMIKNANQGITPSVAPGGVSSTAATTALHQQYVASSTTPSSVISPSSGRPHIVSSTSNPLGNVSPIMQIIKTIQSQIPGVQVSPSVQTFAEKQHQQPQQQYQQQQQHASPSTPQPILASSPRPMVSVTPGPFIQSSPRPQQTVSASPAPIMFSSPRPQQTVSASPAPILFSSPRPQGSPTPTPAPGQVIISSTGFPRVINVSPSASDTPQSIHQAVVEAIMKQQAAEHGAGASPSPGSQIIVTSGGSGFGGGASPGPTSQYVEVIPAGGSIPGLGGDANQKPFVVQLQQPSPTQQQQYHQQHHSSSHEMNLPEITINDPSVHIQKGSLESHEMFTEKSHKQSMSSHSMSMSTSVESRENARPVYSRERYNNGQAKTHHHSKEMSDEYPEKGERRRPSYSSHSKEHYDLEDALNPNRRMYSGENSKQELPSEEQQQEKARKEERNEEEKMIERVITEEKIVWKQGPGQGEMIPAKVRTEERIIIRPSSKEVLDGEFSQRRTPVSSVEMLMAANSNRQGGGASAADLASIERFLQQENGSKQVSSSSQSQSKEVSTNPSNFAGILRSKIKFDKLMERLYPSKQLVSPFTISNNSANFHHHHHHSKEVVPTIASSLITTPQAESSAAGHILSSVGPTMSSMISSTFGGSMSSLSPTPTAEVGSDQGRFKIRPGDVLNHMPPADVQKAQRPEIFLGVSPSGQPMIIQQSSPMSPTASSSSGTSEVEQRLIFIPQGTAATSPNKSNKPKILITTVDELPDLMAQLSGSGTNPEVRMVPDKATLEAELAKIAASSTVEAQTQKSTSASTTTTTTTTTLAPQPPPTMPPSPSDIPSVQSGLFRISPTPTINNNNNGIRRMDGPERAFTWHPQINTTVASPVSTTPFDSTRRLVSGLGAGMLHAMSAGFGNVGNGLINKYSWLGPSAIPPQQQQQQHQQHHHQQQQQQQQQPMPTQQVIYAMQNGIPIPISTTIHHPQQQKLPIVGPYQQVLIQQQQQMHDPNSKDGLQGGAPLGYYSYKWGNLIPEQPPTLASTTTTTATSSTKSPEYTLKYRSQYRDDDLPVTPIEEKIKPVGPVHKLKKGVKARVKTTSRTTINPIDPVSAEEYEDEEDDDDDVEQEDLIPHETMLPKHMGRGKQHRNRDEDNDDDDDNSSPENKRQQQSKHAGHRRRRPGKLTREDEEDDDDDDEMEDAKRKRQKLRARPTKPTYDEEDDASPAPKQFKTRHHAKQQQQQSNRRLDVDINSSEPDAQDEDYEVYDVKPVLNVSNKRNNKTPPPTVRSTTTVVPAPPPTPAKLSKSKNKAIYVNREMFMVSGEEKSKESSNNPKAEPVYQPSSQQQQPALNSVNKYPILQAPSIISGQSVVIKSGPGNSDDLKATAATTTTLQPKPTSASTTTSTTTTTATTKLTTAKAKVAPTTTAGKTTGGGKGNNKHGGSTEDYTDAQDELRSLLKKIQDRLTVQDEVYDFGEDQALYDYYDDLNQQALTTKASLTSTSTTTKGTQKPGKKKNGGDPKKNKKDKKKKNGGGKKKNGKKNGKKGNNNGNKGKKKNGKNKKKNNNKENVTPKPINSKKIVAVTQSIPTRKPVQQQQTASTTVVPDKTTSQVYLQHHQRHPVSSLEQFTNEEQSLPTVSTTTASTTTTSSTTTTTTTPLPPAPPVPLAHSMEETYSAEVKVISGGGSSQQSGSVETAGGVSYVFSENANNGNPPRMKKRPLWVRRRMGGVATGGVVGSGEGLQSIRTPNGPAGKVIRLVRRRRPVGGVGGRRRMMQQRRQQQLLQEQQQQQHPQHSYEQHESISAEPVSSTTTPSTTTTSTHVSIEVAPPNYSSPPLEQYFEQNSLERRVGSSINPDSNEKVNGTVTLRSPKRKLKLIRLKGQRAQWRLRLQGNGEEDSSSEGGPRPSALVAPRQVSAPLPLQAPLPAPVFTSKGLHSSSSSSSTRAAKSASDLITHYTTSYSSSAQDSESNSVETRVCVRGKCEIVSRQ